MIIKLLYDYKKPNIMLFQDTNIGFNPDDGVKIGFITSYINKFNQNPYTETHSESKLLFATDGYELTMHIFQNQ
jgi:hypothetical protein